MKKSNAHKMLKAVLATTWQLERLWQPFLRSHKRPKQMRPSFSDVKNISSHYFYEGVMNLAERGVISGYVDGTFRPTKTSVVHMLQKLWR